MGSSRSVTRGEIWLVDFDPAMGNEIKKSRPALIIQNDVANKYSPITIIAPITSQHIEKLYPTDVFLARKHSKLAKDSKAVFNQIRAIDKRRLLKRLGKITDLTDVDDAIRISLGLVSI